MLCSMILLLLLAVTPQQGPVQSPRPSAGDLAAVEGPNYTAEGQLKMPERYREWIFLTSGVDMSYSPSAAMAGHSMFDNVFVNPSAYRAFQQTGTWPDKTTLVLEGRGAEGPSSINKREHTQSQEVMGMEVHVKDARLEGGWDSTSLTGLVAQSCSGGRRTATSATKATPRWIRPLFSSIRRCSSWRSRRGL